MVPTLNEAERIARTLSPMLAQPALARVVVADGGSTDGTRAIVAELARGQQTRRARQPALPLPELLLVDAPPGRARQLNAGARCALDGPTVEVLHFVHADCGLPPSWVTDIERCLREPSVVAGAFRTWTVDDSGRSWLGPLLHLADLRSRYSGLPYGDQAPFVRRGVFEQLGGFADIPLMEDLELSRRLQRLGRVATVPSRVQVSGRRFVQRPVFYTALVNVFPALYRLGVSPSTLARLYRHVR